MLGAWWEGVYNAKYLKIIFYRQHLWEVTTNGHILARYLKDKDNQKQERKKKRLLGRKNKLPAKEYKSKLSSFFSETWSEIVEGEPAYFFFRKYFWGSIIVFPAKKLQKKSMCSNLQHLRKKIHVFLLNKILESVLQILRELWGLWIKKWQL